MDTEVLQYAVAENRTLVTSDLGFANLLTIPLGSHSGILVARLPNELPGANPERHHPRGCPGLRR
jgi:predicted nuclease of predicted toxin-antitoxin system